MGYLKLRYSAGTKFALCGSKKGYRFGFNNMHPVYDFWGIENFPSRRQQYFGGIIQSWDGSVRKP